jgi:hypothetical protein
MASLSVHLGRNGIRLPEKRAALRRRTLKGGRIVFNRRGASIDCIVRDLSETGTCLQVESPAGIPDTFELLITDDKSVELAA